MVTHENEITNERFNSMPCKCWFDLPFGNQRCESELYVLKYVYQLFSTLQAMHSLGLNNRIKIVAQDLCMGSVGCTKKAMCSSQLICSRIAGARH